MNNGLVASYENNIQLFAYASDIAKKYGLYSKNVIKPNYSGKPDIFVVFSVEPIAEDVNPVEIINRNERNATLFYPENYAVNIAKENPLMAWEKIRHYLGDADFLCELYNEFDLPLPKKIRNDELSALVTYCCGRNNPQFDIETRNNYAQGLRDFFEEEKSKKSKFKREWNEFYRSELFDEDKSFIGNFFAFLKRDNPETSLEVLTESNFSLKKLYIPEHFYDEFKQRIKEDYPDVKYNVSDIKVVDKGAFVDPKTGARADTQFGKSVTDAELNSIVEKRFDTEGFACMEGLDVFHYEGRDLFYKASDENIIASVYNDLRLKWAKRSTSEELLKQGPLEQVDIPIAQMKKFYVCMQQFGIPFAIDNDANNNPKLETVHVLYNAENGDVIGKLLTGITFADITNAYVRSDSVPVEFNVQQVDALIHHATEKAAEQLSDSTRAFLAENKEFI